MLNVSHGYGGFRQTVLQRVSARLRGAGIDEAVHSADLYYVAKQGASSWSAPTVPWDGSRRGGAGALGRAMRAQMRALADQYLAGMGLP